LPIHVRGSGNQSCEIEVELQVETVYLDVVDQLAAAREVVLIVAQVVER
jgi:hypothetical protein